MAANLGQQELGPMDDGRTGLECLSAGIHVAMSGYCGTGRCMAAMANKAADETSVQKGVSHCLQRHVH